VRPVVLPSPTVGSLLVRARGASALFVTVLACAVSAGCLERPAFPQSEACRQVLELYFSDEAPVQSDGDFTSFQEQRSHVEAAYGEEGACWSREEQVAAACDARCRELLYDDCLAPFLGEDPAAGACDFPPPCKVSSDCGANGTCGADECCVVPGAQATEGCSYEGALPG
jgi:hypothetical protein